MQSESSVIKKYSQISQLHTILIDNLNEFTNTVNIVEKIEFMPVFRVYKRSCPSESPKVIHEKYFLSSQEAFMYWSDLMKEKTELF